MNRGPKNASARAAGLAMAGLCLALAACQQPVVGERYTGAAIVAGPRVELTDAWIDLHGHVVATFSATEGGVPLPIDRLTELAPRFTLAALGEHPVDGLRAWESLLLTGCQVATKLPPAGPGTPDADVLTNVRQPGFDRVVLADDKSDRESGACHHAPDAFVDLGAGRFRYVFANAVAGVEADATLRVGMWLDDAPSPSLDTSSTFDFRPAGGPVDGHDPVLDDNCRRCHGTVVAHESVTRVRLCATCHTWQSTDPDTIDPAALVTTATTAKTDPNPLELGRLLHRVHRAKDLPTIYASSWDPAGASTVPSTRDLPAPFVQHRPGLPAGWNRNPLPGRKYSVIGHDGHEVVFARAIVLAPFDPSIATSMLLAEGGMFPRDLRDCAVCHGGAPEGDVVTSAVSRRTCSGCHPEVWYEASPPLGDAVRFPHPGGPQDHDADCGGCHVAPTASQPKLYAPIAEVHVPPARARRYNEPVVEIVKVEDLAPGMRPKVTFRLYDRVGPIAPTPSNPTIAYEPEGLTTSYVPGFEPGGLHTSAVPRKFAAAVGPAWAPNILIKIIGPTTPDYSASASVQLLSSPATGNPDPALLTVSSGDEYVYTFTSIIPPGTTGTFAVGMEARRSLTRTHYDKTTDTFRWPFTGEPVNETAENVIVYVNTESGAWPPPPGSPPPVPRRTVVEQQKCLVCHDRIEFHSGQKHDANWCVTCHTPDETDIDKRLTSANAGRLYPGGPVRIGATYDGIEERSSHFKMMMHRTHTGSRRGIASLEGIAPYVLYYGKAYFFDRGGFPNDLANCTLCHSGKSYLIESVPLDAPATIANEQATVWHPEGQYGHAEGEPSAPPIQAACLGCHATGATFSHVAAKTVDGAETCASCHSKGALSVDVAHGLAPPSGGAGSTFSSILETVLVPRCATSGCHAIGASMPELEASVAYEKLVNGPTARGGTLVQVKPGAPEESYLLVRLRSDMPPGALLDAADVAAIEAWISNGAPND